MARRRGAVAVARGLGGAGRGVDDEEALRGLRRKMDGIYHGLKWFTMV